MALKDDNAARVARPDRLGPRAGVDLALIEVMPLGEIGDRTDQYLSLKDVRADLGVLDPDRVDHRTGGPARYVRVARPAAGSASSRR